MSHTKLPNSYLAHDIYRQLVDSNHFLVKVEEIFDWHEIAEPLIDIGDNERADDQDTLTF